MKTCSKCKVEKPEESFSTRGRGVRRGTCRKCWNVQAKTHKKNDPNYGKEYRLRRRMFIINYFTKNPCVDCGETNPVILEFDHLPEVGAKSFDISGGLGGQSIKEIVLEIAKCEVRCANCHRKKTAERDPRHWSHILLTGSPGLEPRQGESKSPVLPLHHEPIRKGKSPGFQLLLI